MIIIRYTESQGLLGLSDLFYILSMMAIHCLHLPEAFVVMIKNRGHQYNKMRFQESNDTLQLS